MTAPYEQLRLGELESQITAALRKVGVPDPEVTVTQVEAVDRGQTGKLKRFIPLKGARSEVVANGALQTSVNGNTSIASRDRGKDRNR